MQRTFNYDEFIRGYRAACAKRGIDPLSGASGYQVVHIKAEARRAKWQADRWWQRQDKWLDCPPYRSETEEKAIWRVFRDAYSIMVRLIAQAIRVRKAKLSLRELHQEQEARHP